VVSAAAAGKLRESAVDVIKPARRSRAQSCPRIIIANPPYVLCGEPR
jgi:hypothetical protein